ncbi:TPA: hypothetical protein ACH3X2_013528 [Trebouxia sp. C0005]
MSIVMTTDAPSLMNEMTDWLAKVCVDPRSIDKKTGGSTCFCSSVQLRSESTGHAEVNQMTCDPSMVSWWTCYIADTTLPHPTELAMMSTNNSDPAITTTQTTCSSQQA